MIDRKSVLPQWLLALTFMARMGFGRGFSYLNVNRDVVDPDTRLWLSSRLKPGCAEAAIDGGLMNPLVANDK